MQRITERCDATSVAPIDGKNRIVQCELELRHFMVGRIMAIVKCTVILTWSVFRAPPSCDPSGSGCSGLPLPEPAC